MQSEETALAYCAGLFDAEGSITIYGKPKRPVLRLVMGSEEAVRYFQYVVGTGIVKPQHPRPPRNTNWRWYCGKKTEVFNVLERLRPYIINQKEQLSLMDEFVQAASLEEQDRILANLRATRKRFPFSRQQKL